MVLPLLFSLGLPALAGTGALGATLAKLSVPALAGIGAGLGSFVQTGDIGKGIQTGMTSFLGGKYLVVYLVRLAQLQSMQHKAQKQQ